MVCAAKHLKEQFRLGEPSHQSTIDVDTDFPVLAAGVIGVTVSSSRTAPALPTTVAPPVAPEPAIPARGVVPALLRTPGEA